MPGSETHSMVPVPTTGLMTGVREALSGVLVSDASSGVARVSYSASNAVPVLELLDVSDEASRLGFQCRVALMPPLAQRVEPLSVLTALRKALTGTAGDPATAVLSGVALSGRAVGRVTPVRDFEAVRPFLRRAVAGIGGTSDDGGMLALQVAGHDGSIPVLCTLSRLGPLLVLMALDVPESELKHHIYWFGAQIPVPQGPSPSPALFVLHGGHRYVVTTTDFVIGRNRVACDLPILDNRIARKHAAVIHRNGRYYLKDLGSADGVHYRGMRIDNKRIDEGDVFQIGDHDLRFTYRADG
ncbi:MAG: FHA domain-containing protein [Deltaproteobacteria bacterium]|nr:MAG: FHA domain-containing protein [Deltaproteobacteria bacterium]